MDYYEEYNFNHDSEYGLLVYSDLKYSIINSKYDNIINNRAIHNDIVYIENNKVVGIKTRNTKKIAGILYLNKNTKYGFNSKKMPYYVFIPLNKKYPKFLVASSSKSKVKEYVVITFNKWPIQSKHPYGKCEHVIGPINIYDNMYKILLYRYDLVFNKLKIPKDTIQKHLKYNIDNIDYQAFTIDPKNCTDIDDAISFEKHDSYIEIGVHITDVSYFIEDLYSIIYNLTTSIYYDNTQINMLPEIYSSNICSLLENTTKRCVSVLFKFSNNYELLKYNIQLSNVYIIKNLDYTNADIIIKNKNTNYTYLLDLWNFMTKYDKSITDTHLLIEKLMILTNHKIASVLYKYDKKNTILRTHTSKIDNIIITNENHQNYENHENHQNHENHENHENDEKLKNYLKYKTFNSAVYETNVEKPTHYGLHINYYTHFTSPIRRCCDIINHINIKKFIRKLPLLEISEQNIYHMNYINKQCKKLYYDYKIVDLLKKFDKNCNITSEAYIVSFDTSHFLIYIPQFDIEYTMEYFNKNLNYVNQVEINENSVLIKNNNNIIKTYKKYMKYNIDIFLINEEEKLHDKIKIKINI